MVIDQQSRGEHIALRVAVPGVRHMVGVRADEAKIPQRIIAIAIPFARLDQPDLPGRNRNPRQLQLTEKCLPSVEVPPGQIVLRISVPGGIAARQTQPQLIRDYGTGQGKPFISEIVISILGIHRGPPVLQRWPPAGHINQAAHRVSAVQSPLRPAHKFQLLQIDQLDV